MRIWIVLALLLAGCADPADPQTSDEAIHQEEPDDGATPRNESVAGSLHVNVTLTESQVQTPVSSHGFGGSNCANFDVDQVLRGTATATWTPKPGMESIQLGMLGENTRERVTGTSPLTFDLPADVRHDFFDDVKIFVQAPEPGALIDQEVRVEIQMDYVGGSGDHDFSSCSIG